MLDLIAKELRRVVASEGPAIWKLPDFAVREDVGETIEIARFETSQVQSFGIDIGQRRSDRRSKKVAQSRAPSASRAPRGIESTSVSIATTTLPAARARIPLIASLMAGAAGLTWSFGAIAAKKADQADTWQYLIWRSIAVIVVIEAISRLRGKGWMLPRAYTSGRLMIVGCVALFVASIGYVYALKTTTAANAAFLASVTPLVAVVLARAFLGERLTRVTIGAIGVALVGLTVMVASDLDAGNLKGNLSALASSVGFAAYTVCVRSDPQTDWSPILPGYASMMIVICGIVTLSQGHALLPPAKDTAWAMLHGGVFIVAGTMLFNVASRTVPAVAMTIFAQSETVFVPIWAFLVVSERPKFTAVLGGAIIFSAVIGKAMLDARPVRDVALEPGPGSIA